MGRFLVMDVVFYGGSLNYDQGTGNYQELKKITKWDGKQYTLVSRYALRYSLLETGKMIGVWKIAEGNKLQLAGEGDKKVIQPATELLLRGELLKYPEFDLFGYLITSTDPQNFRTAPAKISHAISMTPFNYDALFNANIGLANRVRKTHGDMKPNPFTAEEHVTYYQYTVVVDIDKIGNMDVYINEGKEIKLKDDKDKWKVEKIDKSDGKIKITLKKNKETKIIEQNEDVNGALSKINNLALISYSLKDEQIKERVEQLISVILNLKRDIKGRAEDLKPKLIVVGVYKDKPYKTYKDRIYLVDEYTEESYDEIEEKPEENSKRIVRVKHVVSKSKKPRFELLGDGNGNIVTEKIYEKKIRDTISGLFDNNKKDYTEIKVFYDPCVEVKIKNTSENEE